MQRKEINRDCASSGERMHEKNLSRNLLKSNKGFSPVRNSVPLTRVKRYTKCRWK